jgi:hypothetical protein
MAGNKINREISIYINDIEVVNSMAGISRAISQTNGEIRNLNKNSATYDQDLKRLTARLSDLKEKQAEFKEELQDTVLSSNEAKEALTNIFVGLMAGNLQMAKAGILALKGSIAALTKTAIAFISTPLGATIAILAGIAVATREWAQYNIEVAKTSKLIQGITGLTDEALDAVRVKAVAIQKTFGKSMEDTLGAAKVLVNEFGISYDEALSKLEDGLIRGGQYNEEYLDSIKEYSTFFAKAGFSVEEFQGIIDAGFDLGIYTDKLPDAIKEFSLSITEQTKASRDALNNAFGEDFTNRLLKGVKDGSISVKDALKLVSDEAEKLNLNTQQQQQLTADIFRGAGEDAGGFLKIAQAVRQSYKDQGKELTELEKLTEELSVANYELAEAQDAALKSDGFARWQTAGELALTKLKTGFYELLSAIVNTDEEIEKIAKDRAQRENDIYLRDRFKTQFEDYLKRQEERLGKEFSIEKATADKIALLRSFMTEDKKKSYLRDTQLEIDVIEEIAKKRIEALNVSKKQSQEEIDAAKRAADDKRKLREKEEREREKAQKAEEDRLKAILNAQIRVTKAELDYFIAYNASRLTGEKKLTQELLDEETNRLRLIKEKRGEALLLDYRSKLDSAKLEAKSEEELAKLKEAINLEYFTAIQNLDLQFQTDTESKKKEFEEEQKQIKLEQLRTENELRVAESEEGFARQREQEQIRYENEKQALYDKLIAEKATVDQFIRADEVAARNHSEALIKIARAERDAKTAEYGKFFENIAILLGENTAMGKAAAVAAVAISQGLAVARIWETPSTLPSPFDVAAKISGTAVAIANVVAAAKQIDKVKVPKTRAFFYGGPTGNSPFLGYDQYGPVTGVVHSNEWVAPEVMTSSPRYAATFAWLENERQKIMSNGFVDGGPTSSEAVPQNQSDIVPENSDLVQVLTMLYGLLSDGIFAKVFFGYAEAEEVEKLNNERYQSNQNGKVS